jgi:betaine-aldehyde dehydrogenase
MSAVAGRRAPARKSSRSSPATGRSSAHKCASRADGERAIERALAAQADPAWRNLKPHERARFLHRIAEGIEANAARIAYIQTRDTGKTLRETTALVASAAGTFRYFAGALESLDDTLTAPRGDYLSMSVHEPLGLVSAITPWNSPIASDAQKVAPALAAGNAVLLKPASWSPLVSLELARIVEAARLAPGPVFRPARRGPGNRQPSCRASGDFSCQLHRRHGDGSHVGPPGS